MSIQIISAGSYLPELIVSNDDLAIFLDTSDEWITTRCGIKTRHIATNETTTDMGVKAAKIALENSSLDTKDIDLVICATITPDNCVPMVAANIKKGLEIEEAAAFDINGNCSGYVYALTVADSLMKNCGYRNAIVIGSDSNSQILDWNDRRTCVLFGDGAGAAVLSNTQQRGIIASYMNCAIDTEEALNCYNPIYKTPFSDNERLENTKITMLGNKVMRFAVRAAITAVENVIKKSGVSLDDIKFVIPHQANLRIIDSIAKTLGVDADKFYINIDRVANTSSATIPIALDEIMRNNLINRGDIILLIAFGGGLSSGAMLLEW